MRCWGRRIPLPYFNMENVNQLIKVVNDCGTFYFTRPFRAEKFKAEYLVHRAQMAVAFKQRYKVQLVSYLLADIHLYNKIEKNIFKVVINNEEYYDISDIALKVVKSL